MSIDVANVEVGEKYLDKYVGVSDNKVYQITSVKFIECGENENDVSEVDCYGRQAIDIAARMMMCNVLDEHYEYSSGIELLNKYAEKYGEDASYENFTDKEIQLVV